MSLKVTKTKIGQEVLSLSDVKSWLRISFNSDDDLLNNLIIQSRELVETYINQSIVETKIVCEASPRETLVLPYGPIISISGVTDFDGNDIEYTWDGFEISFEPLYSNTITTYISGMIDIPSGLKLILYQFILYLYENRGDDSGFQNLLYKNKYLQQYRKKLWI